MQIRLKHWNAERRLVATIHTCAALRRMTRKVDAEEMPTVVSPFFCDIESVHGSHAHVCSGNKDGTTY